MRGQTAAVTFVAALMPNLGAPQVPLGPEFQVNVYTTRAQYGQRLILGAAGDFVVTWLSYPQDGSNSGVYARRYDAAGMPVDWPEFRLNAVTLGHQGSPAVAAAPDGRLTFTWHSQFQDGDGLGIFSRRFDAFGSPDGGEFGINSYTTGHQLAPSISADQSGHFVLVWNDFGRDGSGRGMFGQRFDANGVPQGGDFAVNSYTTGTQFTFGNAVATSADGRFVVVWESAGQDGSYGGIFGQRYDASGVPVGPEFRVNDYTTGNQDNVSVASDASGNFVIVWTSEGQPGGSGLDVVGRRYDAAGLPQGTEFIVNSQTIGGQDHATVTLDPRGDFVVVWNGSGPADAFDVFGRVFDREGPVTADFVLNTVTTGFQRYPFVASNPAGDFVVAWGSPDGPNIYGIFARRFLSDLIFKDDFESGDLSAWSATAPDGGDLSVNAAAALDSTAAGLHGIVDDTAALYVEDGSPHDEPRYRARFWIDPNGYDPGVAQGHLRTRVFIALTEGPSRRVATIVLRLQSGAYALMGKARLDDHSQAVTGFVPLSNGPHAVELDLRPATGPGVLDGSFELFVDGASRVHLAGLDNSRAAVDFVRMGALAAKGGAVGTIHWDEFESRRQAYIGP
jgi:hypothetical protein